MRTPPRLRARGDASGFTLLEVIITLVLIAALVAAATPSVSRAVAHSSVNNAASVLAGDLEHAFSLAARQRAPVRIRFDPTNKRYLIQNRAGVELRRRTFGPTSDLEVESITPSVTDLDVFPSGLASGPLTVDLRRQGYAVRVTMTRAGKVRIT
jgi:type II secretion system protein H